MPKALPDRRLLGLIAAPLLHGSVTTHPRLSATPPPAPPARTAASKALRARLTLAGLSALEEDIVRLRYELAIAKLRHELAALRVRPRPLLSAPAVHPMDPAKAPTPPAPPDWRVLAILGRGHALQAIVGAGAARETVETGSHLGASRVVRVAPDAVWIRDARGLRRLPITVCADRVGCRPSNRRPL